MAAALTLLDGVAVCSASCVMHPSETLSEARLDTPEAYNMTLDDPTESGLTTEMDAVGSFKIIRCKRHEHGAECMMKCADAGISCQAGRKTSVQERRQNWTTDAMQSSRPGQQLLVLL